MAERVPSHLFVDPYLTDSGLQVLAQAFRPEWLLAPHLGTGENPILVLVVGSYPAPFLEGCNLDLMQLEEKGNPRRSISWDSNTSVGRTGWGISRFDVRRSIAGTVVANPSSPEPATPPTVDPHTCARQTVVTFTDCASSLSRGALCRQSFEIRTGCANERSSGSVRRG